MPSSDATTNVPAPILTDAGFTAPSEQDILAGVLADMNAALGRGANTALSTPQGQIAISETAILGDFLSAMLAVFNGVDPASSSGRMQDAIGHIYFMDRRPATATTVTVQAVVNAPGQTIPAGTVVAQGSDGSLYVAPQAITLPQTSTASLDLTCQTAGAITCPSSSLTLYQAGLGLASLT
ncbi:baseplate J/gp47 family protein, partial [Bombella sp. TMW 2.2559]